MGYKVGTRLLAPEKMVRVLTIDSRFWRVGTSGSGAGLVQDRKEVKVDEVGWSTLCRVW